MLKITIEGGPNEGKTTLASEIAALLSDIGLSVEVRDPDLKNHTPTRHERCIEAMSGREVLIETVQPKRT